MPAARAEHAPWRATARVRKRAESFLVSGAGGVTGCVVRAAQAQMPPSHSHGLRVRPQPQAKARAEGATSRAGAHKHSRIVRAPSLARQCLSFPCYWRSLN